MVIIRVCTTFLCSICKRSALAELLLHEAEEKGQRLTQLLLSCLLKLTMALHGVINTVGCNIRRSDTTNYVVLLAHDNGHKSAMKAQFLAEVPMGSSALKWDHAHILITSRRD